MGYYTQYELEIDTNSPVTDSEIIADLREINECAEFAIGEYGESEESCKWYGHESDLKEFSKKYPNSVFHLEGRGEEQGDHWHKYFKNGKMQVCKAKVSFDDYDGSKLR